MRDSEQLDDPQVVKAVESLLQNEYESNNVFNKTFSGGRPIAINSLIHDEGVRQLPYQIDASELLFFADRDAYYNELHYWENGIIFEDHRSALDAIQSFDQFPVFKELVDAVTRRRIAPFVGAGISYNCKFPLWREALAEAKEKIEDVDEGAFQDAIDSFGYLEAAQILWDKDDTQLRNFICKKFSSGNLTNGLVAGPVLHLPHFCHGCVITTNFDPVIEAAFQKEKKTQFEGYMHGMQPGNKFVPKLIKGDRCILKLHGDAEDYTTYVFTKEQYADAYGASEFDFTKPLPRALRQIFVSHSLLFLGCSLETDRTLELFTHIREQDEFEVPSHFAILPEPDGSGETKTQKESRLLKLNIHPIWFPDGEFQFVDRYLRLLIDASTKRIGI